MLETVGGGCCFSVYTPYVRNSPLLLSFLLQNHCYLTKGVTYGPSLQVHFICFKRYQRERRFRELTPSSQHINLVKNGPRSYNVSRPVQVSVSRYKIQYLDTFSESISKVSVSRYFLENSFINFADLFKYLYLNTKYSIQIFF